jgi:predicted dehydrogenase
MGRLHARVYPQLEGVSFEGVFDADPDSAREVAAERGGRAFESLEAMLREVDALTIAVPTVHHQRIAIPAIDAGVACLIEKPLAPDSATARHIVDHAASKGVLVAVGHIERYNPAVRGLRKLGVTPQFIEVTRISPLTFRSIDVGVVLDMMIHDIDIVLSLAQSPITSVDSTGVCVIGAGARGDAEDVCNARIRFANGCVANLTASRLALKVERKLRVFSPQAYVSLDYQKKQGIVVRRGQNVDALRDIVARIRSGEVQDLAEVNYAELVDVEQLDIDDVEPLRVELDQFLRAVRGEDAQIVTGRDGVSAVEVAERIVAGMNAARV